VKIPTPYRVKVKVSQVW